MLLLWRLILSGLLWAFWPSLVFSEPLTEAVFIASPEMEASVQNWHLLADESGQLSLKEVQGERGLFRRLESPDYASSGSQRAVWIRDRKSVV